MIVPDQKVIVGALKCVVDGGGNASIWILERQGVCTCRYSDAQISRGQKQKLRDERDSTLGTARSPLYIKVGVCRAIVRHTYARRLRTHGKCNRRGEIRGNVRKEMLQFVWTSLSCSEHPSLTKRWCVASKLSNVVFGLSCLLGLRNWAFSLWPV